MTTMDTVRVGVGVSASDVRPVARGRLAQDPVSLGRAPGCALRVEHPWMPRRLVTLEPDGQHRLLINGGRTRCRITASGLEATLAPERRMILGAGAWRVRWLELDNPVDLRIDLDVPVDDGDWPTLGDTGDEAGHPRALALTHVAGDDFAAVLTAKRRFRLAVLFEHEINGTRPPEALFRSAADRAGCSEQVLKNLAADTKEQLNRQRGLTLESTDSLGYYLVHTAGVVRREHLCAPT
jgi:hypothetical protein